MTTPRVVLDTSNILMPLITNQYPNHPGTREPAQNREGR